MDEQSNSREANANTRAVGEKRKARSSVATKVFLALGTAFLLVCVTAFTAAWYLGLLPLIFSMADLEEPFQILHLDEQKLEANLPSGGSPAGLPDTGETPRTIGTKSEGHKRSAAGTTAEDPASGTSPQEQLRQEIEARYISRLEKTAKSYEGKLNNLVEEAWKEYAASQKSDKRFSLLALARKNIAAGKALEAQCDAEFYAILEDFKKELRANSLPLDTAYLASREYEKAKIARKKEILSAAAKVLSSQSVPR